MDRENTIPFTGIAPFQLRIQYVEADEHTPKRFLDMHIHEECQLYLNLTGDVEFMVEDHLYPIAPGSVMLVRPNELHHCVYRRTDMVHKHFCIYFTAKGNEALLKRFFDRKAGQDNLIKLREEDFAEAKKLCLSLLDCEDDPVLQYRIFFELLVLLEKGERYGLEVPLPTDVKYALDYIYENLAQPITVKEIAAAAFVSINTLERHFLAAIKISPREFLKQRRLNNAAYLLKNGASVSDACQGSGFSDCSHFIGLFKQKYGVTPLQFKKKV